MSEPQYSFEPEWKEKLMCRTPWAVFVVELTMGTLHVYFPDEQQWQKCMPPHLQEGWRKVLPELQRWCTSQKIPLSIVSDAWVEVKTEQPRDARS